MSVKIDLDETEWDTTENVLVRGDIFRNGEYVGTDVGPLLEDATDETSFRKQLANFGGQFAVIVERPDTVYAAVDHIGSIPLYYGFENEVTYISDSAVNIGRRVPTDACDPDASAEFLLTTYVTGNDTLFPHIKQLQPGQVLSVSREQSTDPSIERHFSFTAPDVAEMDRSTALERLDTVLTNAFERLVDRAAGAPIIIALSGGYDSRLLALMLDRIGYDNVYTFTFPDFLTEGDAHIAKQIANDIGFNWTFIEMTGEDFWEFYHSDEYTSLKRTMDDYASVTPYLFWMLVLKKVQASSDLPDSGIILTGHDIAGSANHLPRVDDGDSGACLDTAVEWIWNRHYSARHLDDSNVRSTMEKRIRDRLPPIVDGDAAAVKNATISWYWQERTPKFLIRHVDGYRYWGYDRWLPLWDRELATFWGSVPFEFRRGKSLYKEYIDHMAQTQLSQQYSIAGSDDTETSTGDTLSVLDTIVSRLPVETVVRNSFRQWQSRKIKDSPQARRYGFLSTEQFDRLYPQARHAKYFHALEKVSRLGCYPPEGTPLHRDVHLYESSAGSMRLSTGGESS